MADDPLILLSFDVEEFDIPLEYGHALSTDEQFEIGRAGFERVLELLESHSAKPVTTLFTCAVFGERYGELVHRAVRGGHEIASHGYTHGPLEPGDLEKSRVALERLTDKPVTGFRRARMAATDAGEIERAGYAYNSSEHPVYMPGRYNNFFKPRMAYRAPGTKGLINIPVSATPILRIPMFWVAFKNFPLAMVKACAARTLAHDGVVNFYWHPWEFSDISPSGSRDYKLPKVVRVIDGERLRDRLADFVSFLSRRGKFGTFSEYHTRLQRSLMNGDRS